MAVGVGELVSSQAKRPRRIRDSVGAVESWPHLPKRDVLGQFQGDDVAAIAPANAATLSGVQLEEQLRLANNACLRVCCTDSPDMDCSVPFVLGLSTCPA